MGKVKLGHHRYRMIPDRLTYYMCYMVDEVNGFYSKQIKLGNYSAYTYDTDDFDDGARARARKEINKLRELHGHINAEDGNNEDNSAKDET